MDKPFECQIIKFSLHVYLFSKQQLIYHLFFSEVSLKDVVLKDLCQYSTSL